MEEVPLGFKVIGTVITVAYVLCDNWAIEYRDTTYQEGTKRDMSKGALFLQGQDIFH